MSRETRVSVARSVTSQLHIAEEAIDSALTEAATLLENCITSRRTLRISTLVGTKVNDSTIKAMQALQDAQAHMADAHRELTRIQKQFRLEPAAHVPPYDPDKGPEGGGGDGGVTHARRDAVSGTADS
ncbi:hypothetical protein [Asticcacaulis biprosthecium]|uniref:hypothetical protein n=1 Tax=Asticcacaulis biprosthecium TaxID=76891 RepID=UPI0012F48F29|nr:hypothetical protein [Asticcacaulis biprosthecium]